MERVTPVKNRIYFCVYFNLLVPTLNLIKYENFINKILKVQDMKLLHSILVGCLADLSPFKDDILYEIKWAGEEANLDVPGVEYSQEDFVTGSNNLELQ